MWNPSDPLDHKQPKLHNITVPDQIGTTKEKVDIVTLFPGEQGNYPSQPGAARDHIGVPILGPHSHIHQQRLVGPVRKF